MSALVVFLDAKDADFPNLVLEQIKELRKQIKKPADSALLLGPRRYVADESMPVQAVSRATPPDHWGVTRAAALAQPGTPRYIY